LCTVVRVAAVARVAAGHIASSRSDLFAVSEQVAVKRGTVSLCFESFVLMFFLHFGEKLGLTSGNHTRRTTESFDFALLSVGREGAHNQTHNDEVDLGQHLR
jgi:hypothetical protein